MKPIFISYRRDDNISAAKLLKAILESELGKGTVFLDTTTMGPGEKWKETLKNAVTGAKVVIALIGPYWKGEKYWRTKKAEDNRLLNAEDWVRLELETALQDKKKKIIPMIFHPDKIEVFNDTGHFQNDSLPASLLPLSGDNNKAIIHEKQFEDDLKRTIIELSVFIKSDDVLAELPLPDFDPRNPLDHFPKYPFKGLDYFTEQDARIFFGRDEQIKELFYKLSANKLVLFYGQSGVGKSSLLFAGLKRRLEGKGWTIRYLRREPVSNIAEILNFYVTNVVGDKNSLVIIDQIEEIYTNQSKILSVENEKFQLVESIENALKRNIHVLLSFREEYLAKIQELLDQNCMQYVKMPLRHMQVKGVLEAIEGITKAPEVKYNYNLFFEEKKDLPQKIAYSVLNDKESHVAPLLQLLLRKLWDHILDNNEERVITEKLFDEVKSQSLNEMFDGQVKSLRENFAEEVDNGLVLALLYFFTTPRGTSASHTNEELRASYVYERIIDLAEALKNKYLLIGIQSGKVTATRLAHDSLAPLIREHYAQSNLPGQRASRLLESKSGDIEAGYEVEFSKPDLLIIDAGKCGMRKISIPELKVIEQSWKRIQNYELELEEKNKQLELALKEAKDQNLQAKAKALAADSRKMLQTDPTHALRMAEAACKTTKVPTHEALSAFADIIRLKSGFYKYRIEGHKNSINSVGVSPDGRFILTGSGDKTAKLWNLEGKLLQSFDGYKDIILSVAFSPDGKYILISGTRNRQLISYVGIEDNEDFKTAQLWGLDGTLRETYKGHLSDVLSIAFSPDGKYVLTGSYDLTAKLWNLNGNLLHTLKGHTDSIVSVTFSPDGKFILTGSHDKTARLWDLDGNLKQSFEGHTDAILSTAFSPNGKNILIGSQDKTAKLWNLDGTLKQSFEGHTGAVFLASFSPDGRFILTGSMDKTAMLWNLDGKLMQSFEGHNDAVFSVSFSPDGKSLITGGGDGVALVWNLDGTINQNFHNHSKTIYAFSFSPSGKFILTGSMDKKAMLWNVDGTLRESFYGHEDTIFAVAFSPDEKFILTGSADKTAKIWNLNGTLSRSFKGHTNYVRSVAFSPKGESILTGSYDKTAILWSLNGTFKQSFKGHKKEIMSVAFSPDGKSILTGSADKTAKIWDLDGKLKQSFKGHKKEIMSVAFSPDGKFILTGSGDKTAKIWNLDGTQIQSFEGHNHSVLSVAFSPDGKFILTGSADNSGKLWALDGIIKQSFEWHKGNVITVAFSPNGKLILTGSTDKTLRLWRPFWEIINPENTYVPNLDQLEKYNIPKDLEWGKVW